MNRSSILDTVNEFLDRVEQGEIQAGGKLEIAMQMAVSGGGKDLAYIVRVDETASKGTVELQRKG